MALELTTERKQRLAALVGRYPNKAAACLPALRRLAGLKDADPNVRLEAVTALGVARDASSLNLMLDAITDPWPALRVAASMAAMAS